MIKKYFFLLLFYNRNMKRLEEDFWREFCQEKNIDITEVLELVKEYYSESLFKNKGEN